MNLENNTALITGASSGIGEQFAITLAARGVNVVLVARRADKLAELRNKLLADRPGLDVEVVAADLSEPGSGAALADKIAAGGRHIDILINNAGVGSHRRFVDEDPEDVAAQIQLNCGTLVDLTARFLPAMVEAKHGLVINVASTAAFQPTPNMAVYGASKAFVLSFTEALWQETRHTGVRIMALCPGATETEFFARAGQDFMTRGRQTPQQVVETAMNAIDKSTPTVISGRLNTFLANGYRIAPRQLLVAVSERMTQAAH